MEQISLKSTPSTCENSLATEVGKQMSSNSVSVSNFAKSTCRTKNGLVNGVAEEKCSSSSNNTRVTVLANPDLGTTSSDVHHQNIAQNYVAYTDISVKHVEADLKHKSSEVPEPNQHDCNCSDPQCGRGKTKLNDTTPFDIVEKCIAVEENLQADIDSSMSKGEVNELQIDEKGSSTAELTSNFSSVVNRTTELSQSEQEFTVDLDILTIDKSSGESMNKCGEIIVQEIGDAVGETKRVEDSSEITYVQYKSELQMPLIMKIIQKDLSEPYSIYTYRYFIHNWPKLCFLAMSGDLCVGAIVCKLDYHRKSTNRGYIAMLAVDQHYRNRKIGSTLVRRAIKEMINGHADEVVLETEVTNKPALRLYELLGFVRDKRLFRYYLNGVDALRLKLWLR